MLCYFLVHKYVDVVQSVASKAQVLSELQFTLGQMERALQANPSDRSPEGHIHVLRQVGINPPTSKSIYPHFQCSLKD